MKTTMNQRDVARMNKLLAQEVKPAEIAKALKVDPKTLKSFMDYEAKKGGKKPAVNPAEKPAETK